MTPFARDMLLQTRDAWAPGSTYEQAVAYLDRKEAPREHRQERRKQLANLLTERD